MKSENRCSVYFKVIDLVKSFNFIVYMKKIRFLKLSHAELGPRKIPPTEPITAISKGYVCADLQFFTQTIISAAHQIKKYIKKKIEFRRPAASQIREHLTHGQYSKHGRRTKPLGRRVPISGTAAARACARCGAAGCEPRIARVMQCTDA